MNKSKKTIKIWAGINKNKTLSLHTSEPKRNNLLGIWESESPFVNSVIYKELIPLFEKTEINFNSPCQFFEINL